MAEIKTPSERSKDDNGTRMLFLIAAAISGTLFGWIIAAGFVFRNPVFENKPGLFLSAWALAMLFGGAGSVMVASLLLKFKQK